MHIHIHTLAYLHTLWINYARNNIKTSRVTVSKELFEDWKVEVVGRPTFQFCTV